ATTHHTRERIFGDDHRQPGFFLQQTIQVAQQCTAARQGNALVGDVGAQLGRRLFEAGLDRRDDLVERIGERFEDFVGGNREAARHALGKVAPLDLEFLDFGTREGRTDFFLDELGRRFTDQHAVVATDVIDDGFVELVAAHPYGTLVDHAAERDDGHFRGAPADVHDHRAAGIRHREPGTDGGGHGFFDQVNLTGARTQSRFADGATLDLGRTAGHANDDARAGREHTARMHHANELLEHLLGHREVGDDTVLHGPNGFYIAWYAAQHLLGLAANCLNDLLAAGTAFLADGNHRWLVEHDTLAPNINQGVGGTEVDRHIAGKITAEESEHGVWDLYVENSVCPGRNVLPRVMGRQQRGRTIRSNKE